MSVTPGGGRSDTSKTFLTALITNAALLGVEVGAFVILKQKLGRIYQPRTYLPPKDKRSKRLPNGPWKWVPALLQSPLQDVIHNNGLDAYMFLRYLRLLITLFFIFTMITFPILLPIDAAGIDTGRVGLDRITWSNLADSQEQIRFVAHILLAYLLTGIVIYMIRREMDHFVHMRHQFLLSKSHSRLPQARTVLVTAVPQELGNERDLRTFASFTPGGVDRVWLYRDTKALNEVFEKRQNACAKLEAAISKVFRKAMQAWRVKEKIHKRMFKKLRDNTDPEKHDATYPNSEQLERPIASLEFLDRLVPREERPTHRVGIWGMVGKKVDTIDWCKSEISRLNVAIADAREGIVKGKFLGSAFMRCHLQMGAHVLAQCVSYHEPNSMYDKWMEAHPKDIVWENLDDGALEMRSRYLVSWLITFGLIIAWAFPVAFVGTLSNIDDLCNQFDWLAWVCRVPEPLPGLIQGVLPPILLAILFAILPLILRALAWYECIPRYSLISVSVYKRFFIFLVIHGFLIVTITSGVTKAIEQILEQPTLTVSKLAQELPGASIFFLAYMVTQGFSGAGSALIQLMPLIIHYIRKWFLGRTPRQAYEVTFLMPVADFGIVLPRMSLLATIGFAYSIITPLINFLGFVSFTMLYIAWKFLFTQVFDQPDERETGGMYFPMAMSNLFVGLYIKQICLACLFFLKISVSRGTSLAGGILMIILIFITFTAQMFIKHSFDPISLYLPMSLATKKMAKRYEQLRHKRLGSKNIEPGEIDLFSRNHIRSVRRKIQMFPKRIDATLDILKGKRRDEDDNTSLHGGKDKVEEEKQIAEVKVMDVSDLAAGRPSDATAVHGIEVTGAAAIRSSSRAVSIRSVNSDLSKRSVAGPSNDPEDAPSPSFANPIPIGINLKDEDDEEGEVGDLDEHAFDHPSTYVDQPWVWVPKDRLGLSEVIVNDLRKLGVKASDLGSTMDEKGVVEVTRNPPDEVWEGDS